MAVETQAYTLEEFDRLVEQPEYANRLFEYVGGEIVEVVSNNYSSEIAMRIGARLLLFVEEHNLGRVTGADGGYKVSGERYIPDVAFISKAKQPKPSREAYNSNAPDLAVEVLSPGNEPDELRIKVANYLLAGTTVWVVNPDKQRVEVFAPSQPVAKVGLNQAVDGGSVLPGFSLPVSIIFPPSE